MDRMNRNMHLLDHLTDHNVSASFAPLTTYLYPVNNVHLHEQYR